MKRLIYLYLVICTITMVACNNNTSVMNDSERKLTNSGSENTPMRVLTIENHKDSVFLRTPSIDVDMAKMKDDKDFQLLIQRLKVTMDAEDGIGIAAPQVGIGRNVFLFTRIREEGMPVQVVINPKIIATPDSVICFERDGCLSIPGVSGNSFRSPWVKVEYYDENGQKMEETLSGYSRQTDFTGVIFQHEYDHLQGILFIDKLCE